MTLVFATANQNKVKEIQALIPASVQLRGLPDINCTEDIPETQATIEGNACVSGIQEPDKVADNLDTIFKNKDTQSEYVKEKLKELNF
jgi:XTP/dITP diphosphohydrolase